MCDIRFNMTTEERNTRVAAFFASVQQLRRQAGVQFLNKAWFPKISNAAFDKWKNLISSNIKSLHSCASVDELMEKLWDIKANNDMVGIGEITIHRTAEILADTWDLDRNANCWSMAYSLMTRFCIRNNITKEVLIESVEKAEGMLAKWPLMDKIIFVNSLLRSNSLEII